MIDTIYWDKNVIVPIKHYILKKNELAPFYLKDVEHKLNLCSEADEQEYILDALADIYRDYCAGKWKDYWLQGCISQLMRFDQDAGRVIPHLDPIETAFSWAEHNETIRVNDFIELMSNYDLSCACKDWVRLEERVNHELEKLKVYGDSTKGGYLALLHAYVRIKTCAGNDGDMREENLELLERHWDFLKLVYSVRLRRIVDCGHRDFAAIANNFRVMKSHYKYIHIAYSAIKERIETLDTTEEGRKKINYHLEKMLKTEKDTPQDNEVLDDLCKVLFTEEFQQILDKNRMPDYDEIASELQEMKSRVDALNVQVKQTAEQMAAAVKDAIPVETIERELLRLCDFQPGTAYDVYVQLNAMLTGDKAWMERTSDIRERLLEKHNSATVINGNIYQSGARHYDESKHLEIGKETDSSKLLEK